MTAKASGPTTEAHGRPQHTPSRQRALWRIAVIAAPLAGAGAAVLRVRHAGAPPPGAAVPAARMPSGPAAIVGIPTPARAAPTREADAGRLFERRVRVVAARDGADDETSTGSIGLEGIASRLRSKLGRLRTCYERALGERPTLGGRVVLRITIGGDGAVTAVAAHGLEDTPEVGRCVESVAREIRFDPPNGGAVEITVPLAFSVAR